MQGFKECEGAGPGYPECIEAVRHRFELCFTQCAIDNDCDF